MAVSTIALHFIGTTIGKLYSKSETYAIKMSKELKYATRSFEKFIFHN